MTALALAVVGPAAHAATAQDPAPVDPATAADGNAYCTTELNGTPEYTINFVYTNGREAICVYRTQYVWMTAARNAVVREENGQSSYSSLQVGDGPDLDEGVFFHGPGGPVESQVIAGGGPGGWSDYYEVPCSVSSRAAHHGQEGVALSYYLHEVGEAYRRNIAFTELTSPAGNAVAYAPHCQSPLS